MKRKHDGPRLQGLYSSLKVTQGAEQAAREYGEICAYWGRLGGRETLRRYGREHFSRIARKRWATAKMAVGG